MEVIIDGKQWIEMPEAAQADSSLIRALDLRFDSDAGDQLTVRGYFRALLLTLWEENESFSGKRPFGNSGWEYDLLKPLCMNKFIKGKFTKYADGNYDVDFTEAQYAAGMKYIEQLIKAVFDGVQP